MKTFAIFAKFWEEGKVKTRLAQSIGHSYATAIYLLFLRMTLEICQGLDVNKVLGFSPEEKLEQFKTLAPHWDLIPQVESDLGTRMKSFFEQVFSKHKSDASEHKVVLIGSDSPLLPSSLVDEAFARLSDRDVVIGPSHDGGYYLIGARSKTPDIFEEIEWSSEKVLSQTIERLEARKLSYYLLPRHRDIDDIHDLRQMLEELKNTNSDLDLHHQIVTTQLITTIEDSFKHMASNGLTDDQVRP